MKTDRTGAVLRLDSGLLTQDLLDPHGVDRGNDRTAIHGMDVDFFFDARRNFVMLALSPNANIRALCRSFHISARPDTRPWPDTMQTVKVVCTIIRVPLTEVLVEVQGPQN